MQTISSLSDDMTKLIEAKRDSIHKYNTVEGKLNLLDTILKSNWIEDHEVYKFQSLGITLGDIIVQDINFIWVEVEEDGEVDPALNFPDTSLILFPMTMISKE
jgi:hypothetical protein